MKKQQQHQEGGCDTPPAGGRGRSRKKQVLLLLQTTLVLLLSLAALLQQHNSCAAATATAVNSQEGSSGSEACLLTTTTNSDLLEDSLQQENGEGENNANNNNKDGGVVVIAMVDGTLAGLSKESGAVLWQRSSSTATTAASGDVLLQPLVGSSTTTTSSSSSSDQQEEDHHPAAAAAQPTDLLLLQQQQISAVPSIDGTVYLTAATAAKNKKDDDDDDKELPQTTTANIADLVNRAPFFDSTGRLYTAQKTTTAFLLNSQTGEILQVYQPTSSGQQQQQKPPPFLFKKQQEDDLVWLGRVDYQVTVHNHPVVNDDESSFNVEFSSSRLLSLQDMMLHEQKQPLDNLQQPTDAAAAAAYHLSTSDDELVLATPRGHVAWVVVQQQQQQSSTKKKTIAWVSNECFETPAVFAIDTTTTTSCGKQQQFAAASLSVPVRMVPDAVLPEEMDHVLEQMERLISHDDAFLTTKPAISSSSSSSDNSVVVFGSLPASGQLFAMPLATTTMTCADDCLAKGSDSSSSSSSSDLDQDDIFGGGGAAAAAARTQQQQQDGRQDGSAAVVPFYDKHYPRRHPADHDQDDEHHLQYQQQYQQQHNGIPPPNYYYYHHHPYYQQHQQGEDPLRRNNKSRKRYRRVLLKILGWWLPPTVALLFVVSFEMGRRKRQNDKNNSAVDIVAAASSSPSPPAGSSSAPATTTTSAEDCDDGVSHHHMMIEVNGRPTRSTLVGVIQVLDDIILGYGGHGTVVYKGLLDGRQVAVKRMLKTYLASADREISLLIESDGHPNVVRYFMKQVRGDFVYLALELCDLSLHDLIACLVQQQLSSSSSPAEDYCNSFDAAAKKVLFQIASGVRHLHDLRIVHRDLKPMNILLADARRSKKKKAQLLSNGLETDDATAAADPEQQDGKRPPPEGDQADSSSSSPPPTTVCSIFTEGGYVAKISDMGLSKQLVGQSSYYGASLLADESSSSLRGQSSSTGGCGGVAGQQSSMMIVGAAGPGSVGWQAPEVMAMRLPTMTSSAGNAPSSSIVACNGEPVASDASLPLSTAARANSSSIGGSTTTPSPPPEVAVNDARTSRSTDIFSLGCIFHSTLIPGSHPFGEWYEREANIMHNRPVNLSRLVSSEHETKSSSSTTAPRCWDAFDLVHSMIQRNPGNRPTAKQVCEHFFFWSLERKLVFLCDVSDRLEAIDDTTAAAAKSLLLIEGNAQQVVGLAWDSVLDEDLVSNVQRFRTYDPSSVRHLLRLVRNKHHHFDELPVAFRETLLRRATSARGQTATDGLMLYFEGKFPRLVGHCWQVCRVMLRAEDPLIAKYAIPPAKASPRRLRSKDSTSDEAGGEAKSPGTNSPAAADNKAPANAISAADPVHLDGADQTAIVENRPSSDDDEEDDDKSPAAKAEASPATANGHNEIVTTVEGILPASDESVGNIINGALPGLSPLQKKDLLVGEKRHTVLADSNKRNCDIPSGASPAVSEHHITEKPPETATCQACPPSLPDAAAKDDAAPALDLVIWQDSSATEAYNCRGWMRSDLEWERCGGSLNSNGNNKLNGTLLRCAQDAIYRTRLCNHWDVSQGTSCPMLKKRKCIFAHGPVELRVKEGKRNRWGKLVDTQGNNNNPNHSGGEDTYGTAKSIETERKREGKWNTTNKRAPGSVAKKGGGGSNNKSKNTSKAKPQPRKGKATSAE